MSGTIKCGNCSRWTNPLDSSVCKMSSENENLPFKVNSDGLYYCDDFKLKDDKCIKDE